MVGLLLCVVFCGIGTCSSADVRACPADTNADCRTRKGGRTLLQHIDKRGAMLTDVETTTDASLPDIGLLGTKNIGSHLGEDVHDSGSANSADGVVSASLGDESSGARLDVNTSLQSELIIAVGSRVGATVLERASALSEQCKVHNADLLSTMAALRASVTPSNDELDGIISTFIDRQAASQDKCPTQLQEAKRQSTQLHTHIEDLASQVNATEVQIQATTMELTQVHNDMQEVDTMKSKGLKKCEDKHQEDAKMLEIMRTEMAEMQMIANPVQLPPAQSATSSSSQNSRLLELDNTAIPAKAIFTKVNQPQGKTDKAQAARLLAAQTKSLAHTLMSCMAGGSHSATAALLDLTGKGEVDGSSGALGLGDCLKSSPVPINVNGVSAAITLPRTLRDKEHGTYPCSGVNAGYHGSIWLACENGHISPDERRCFAASPGVAAPDEDKCAQEKHHLEEVYVEAYVEISRQVTEFEALVHDTACQDSTTQTANQRMKPLQDKVSKLSVSLTGLTGNLASYRPRMELSSDAEVQLREQIIDLTTKCHTMDETVETLDKVRDAIHVLKLCPPGTTAPHFNIPTWLGHWVSGTFDVVLKSDAEVDKDMNALCAGQTPGASQPIRAAETSEIGQKSISGMPMTNSATVPLMGTCPNCIGNPDEADSIVRHKSGHARICWDPEAELSETGARQDCSSGKKAVLCVFDSQAANGR